MSRKGNRLITIPNGVTLTINPTNVIITGPKGELNVEYPSYIKVEQKDNQIIVTRKNEEKQTKMFHGTINSLIFNAIEGVANGYTRSLHIEGVGYKANVTNNKLNLAIGFSHPVNLDIPAGLTVTCKTPTDIDITGIDKILVGEFAAKVRAIRKPEPYNGKGIMYKGEHIIRKVGKTAEGAKK